MGTHSFNLLPVDEIFEVQQVGNQARRSLDLERGQNSRRRSFRQEILRVLGVIIEQAPPVSADED
jgi:hypothetical protein